MSSNNPNISKPSVVYIDLDCLLDTRLGTLAKKDIRLASEVLNNGYHTREIDEFPGVSADEFKQLYKARDEEVLELSVFTNAIKILQGCVKGTLDNIFKGGQNTGVEIVVNIHPYNLDEETCDDIVRAVALHTFNTVNVKSINVPDEFLFPSFCKENYDLMIRYGFEDWVAMHSKAFETVKMPTMGFISPAIYSKVPTEEEFAELKEQKVHPFKATEMLMAPLFSLRLLEISVFSITNDIKPRDTEVSGSDVVKEEISPDTSS